MNPLAQELLLRLIRDGESFAAGLRQRAAGRPARVILPEAEDLRILAAAAALKEMNLVRPILVGDPAAARRGLSDLGLDPGRFEILDAKTDSRREIVATALHARRGAKGLDEAAAMALAGEALHFAAGLVAAGAADAGVAGAVHPTGEVIQAGLWHLGLAPGQSVVSGAFLMLPPAGHALIHRPLLFADSAIVPEPDLPQLVSIGKAAAQTFRQLVGGEPRLACLSFSTRGSATHPSAEKMAEAARLLRAAGLEADGEMQLDTALVEAVARRKAPDSKVGGKADVLIFPDLNSGNLLYKAAERLGGFAAIGPLVQGLRRPFFDLSRGCDAEAVVNTACIAALMSREDGA